MFGIIPMAGGHRNHAFLEAVALFENGLWSYSYPQELVAFSNDENTLLWLIPRIETEEDVLVLPR